MTETSPATAASFKIYHSTFRSILGPSPSIGLLRIDPDGLATFHEACIYHAASKSVFVTSNQLPLSDEQTSNSTSNKRVIITRIYTHDDLSQTSTVGVTPPDLTMANGGVNYKSGLLFCAQGNKSNTRPSALVFMADPETPHQTSNLISSFYGRLFNSINDVVVHPQDESIWFTDPCYGYHQGIRPEPELPSHVYRFDPKEGSIRAMADDFVRPNGLCFSPDLKLLYVTDTGAVHGAQTVAFDKTGKSGIYAFDILESKHGPFLANRRLFAFAESGCPDGIKCDMEGNVYSGCLDGVNVWNPGGVLLGKILVRGGVANFCFGEKGTLYMCNETRFWQAQLGSHVRGALLGL